jgi:hypothetical protein
MNKIDIYLNEQLAQKGLISSEVHQEIKNYQAKNIFSIRNEVLAILYLSILLFTSGIGILIYNNIDSIGHIAILAVNFILMLVCFYFGVKKVKPWAKHEVLFDNTLYDYVILLGSILATIFIGYLQFQYQFLGSDFSYVSLFTALFCFGVAYYFDNKTVLSIAITAFITFFGITLTPKTLLENDIYNNINLTFTGVAVGIGLIIWTEYANKIQLKTHFQLVFATFALHLLGICCLSGILSYDYWLLFVPIAVAYAWYFYRLAKKLKSISLFVFCLIYTYFIVNILIFKLIDFVGFSDIFTALILIYPFYIIGSIVLFIKSISNFNKIKNASI